MTSIEDARKLPASPGVYLMKDKENKVIYVGKAASLRDRVSQHFRGHESPKNQMLVTNVEGLEYIVTGNEVEALVLESNLIKEHMPRYNVRLRDDKHYPFIRITNEEFPRICIARRREPDGSRYFGPYPDSKAVRKLIKMASGFGIRRCRKKLPCPPCLNYHIKQCAAPCINKVTKEEYQDMLKNVENFLKGKKSALINDLKTEMETHAEKQDYEAAARIRDQIRALEGLLEKQRVDTGGKKEQDIIAIAILNNTASLQLFHVIEGKLRGHDTFSLNTGGSDEIEVLSSFIKQYYQDITPPQEIIVPIDIPDKSIIHWLSEKGSRIKIPKNNVEKGLLGLAIENARMIMKQHIFSGKKEALQSLQKALELPVLPELIEAFDISNISGTDATGSLVAFRNGEPDKKNYRHFRIRTVEGADDFAMMGEIVSRSYRRRKVEGKRMPDLVLIDGGKGQLNAAISALSGLGITLNTAGLAKEFEYIFLPDKESPVILPKDSPALQLLQRIRDEAHRFAVGYHRKLRGKMLTRSALDAIKGIGEIKKRALLQHFRSIEELKKADILEIQKVPGIRKKDADALWSYFHEN